MALLAMLAGLPGSAGAAPPEPFVFLTNWYAEAEHGGFYDAQATGAYARAGLAVRIGMGGPQVNTLQLMAAGQADCVMGSNDMQAVLARANGVPVVTVAAMFQKDPEALVTHPDVQKLEDLGGRTVLISSAAHQGSWPWMKARFGWRDEQARPYTSNLQPFIADPRLVQEAYLTSEPFALEKAGVPHRVHLLADYGYPAYSTTVVCMESTLRQRRAAVAAFLRASIEGWRHYLHEPAAANALIRRENPAMDEAQLAYSVRKIREAGLVDSGDARRLGIGVLTEARLRASYDFLVGARLIDPARVPLAASYSLDFMRDLHVLP
jgi:NitT/TauT family transport system substrate-binding protein